MRGSALPFPVSRRFLVRAYVGLGVTVAALFGLGFAVGWAVFS